MPCRDYQAEEEQRTLLVNAKETKKRLDEVTRLLCDECRSLERGKGHIKYAAERLWPGEPLAVWWEKHKAEDDARKALEKDE